MERERRRRLGAWYTPPALVDFVLREALVALGPVDEPIRALDPSCGDGRFLVAAAGALGPSAQLVGCDLDGGAIAQAHLELDGVSQRPALAQSSVGESVTQLDPAKHASHASHAAGPRSAADLPELIDQLARVAWPTVQPGVELRVGDALAEPWEQGSFDLVIGNPPYLSQMANRTTRGGRSALGGGAYADTAALFVALAVRLVRPGGVVALVLPQSILATRDAGPIRAEVADSAALVGLWVAGERVFDASVYTVVAIFRKGAPQASVARWFGPDFKSAPTLPTVQLGEAPWSSLVADLAGVPAVSPATAGVLADVASVAADFRDEYYGLIGAVADDADGPALITSGLIDVGVNRWGTVPVKFAKQRYERPRVDLSKLTPTLQRWAAERLVPKVLLATQTKVLEAFADPAGEFLPSVPVISVVPNDPADLWRILAALLAPSTSAWAAQAYLGAGLSSGSLKLSAAQVRTLPLPALSWDDAIEPLQTGDWDAFAVAMNAAYGVPNEPVTGWWKSHAVKAVRRVGGGNLEQTGCLATTLFQILLRCAALLLRRGLLRRSREVEASRWVGR